ncbi:MAG TPA: hypothetical protein VLG12_06885, partial [Candidatus Saccharimonadales bacterium]|nr:hypothetical protein [Candidatus Saccharimonadales bacterium]
IDTNGNATTSGTFTTAGGTYDIAEDYPTKDKSIEAGDVVSVDPKNDGHVQKSTKSYDTTILGVYSEKPGFRLSQENSTINGDKAIPVALAGRVPVKVSDENGPIHKGDYLTSSSTSGVAMKATKAGQMVGKALEDFTCQSSTIMSPVSSGCTGKVLAFVTSTYADPNNLLAHIIMDDTNMITSNSIAVPANLQINGKVVTGSLDNALTAISNNLDSIKETADTLQTNIADVTNKANALDARIGNIESSEASTSAQIAQTNDIAKQAVTKTLTLSEQVAALSNNMSDISKKVADILSGSTASQSAISPLLTSNVQFGMNIASSSAELGLDNLTVNNATISGVLNVLGRTTLNDLGVTGNITTGVLSIKGLDDDGTASINTFAGDLKLQNQGIGGIDILSGKVMIDTDGNVNIKQTITAKAINTTKLNIITTDTAASSSAVLSASAGTANMTKGKDSITIPTTAVTKNSIINVTFDGDYSPAVRYWIDTKTAGKSFLLKLDAPVDNDVKFNWWIVN